MTVKRRARRAREGAARGAEAPASDRAGVRGGAPISNAGWEGWNEYAPFYDWENAQTLGRRDVAFWRRLALATHGRVLELGCGTGRLALPIAKSGVPLVGLDRAPGMLARAAARLGRVRSPIDLRLVRGDMRTLPFRRQTFDAVLAPYGVLQSLVRERDLAATIEAVARVLRRGGLFGIDLVPDVPNWREYRNRVQLRGRSGGSRLTLIESVRQDRPRRLTVFTQRYLVARRGRQTVEHRFELTFRTVSIREMIRRLERSGFRVDHLLGDYRGAPWDARADTWIILARRL
jgi:ubiquinone/menaquinone biosynthesis C-methylase UbiE